MKMEIRCYKIGWFFLEITVLLQLHSKYSFALEGVKDGNKLLEAKRGDETDLKDRMELIETQNQQQQRRIENLEILLVEEKDFSKQLNDRISKLEAGTVQCTTRSEEILERPKRPFRLLSTNINAEKAKSNPTEKQQFLGPATNCHELGLLGYTLNGYYLVQKKADSKTKMKIGISIATFNNLKDRKIVRKLDFIYLLYQIALETLVGNVDIKTKSVHFYVTKNSPFRKNGAIPFEVERLNVGGGMNSTSGIFTVPVDGVYHFDFSAVKDRSAQHLEIFLQVNGFDYAFAHSYQTAKGNLNTVSLSSSLRLKANDKVNLYNNFGGVLFDNDYHYTHFTGWLVEEDL